MDERLKRAVAELGRGGYVPGSSASPGWTYNPLPFPGCEGVPCHRPDSPRRWAMIAGRTDFKGRRVLDLGCATGYFSFMAARAGASRVLGIDHDAKAVAVCKAAAAAYDVRGAAFVHGSEAATPRDESFDVGFAMAVLNWMGQQRADSWLAWAKGHVALLWVEMPLRGDGRRGADWLAAQGQAVDWLRAGGFGKVEAVGRTRAPHAGQWRPLYRCEL